jgi:choline dehydrogenase
MKGNADVGTFDYIIVGAGSAGCALAHRLSADPRRSVLLIEAGQPNTSLYYNMPKGFGKAILNPNYSWLYQTEPEPGTNNKPELWSRGKTLGGSSSTNGMGYLRGNASDWNVMNELGVRGWGWSEIGAAFMEMEDHALGRAEGRGAGGPLYVAPHTDPHALAEAFIKAGEEMGLPRRDDMNDDAEGVGYMPSTIKGGRRNSSARAFLEPIRSRANLHVITDTAVRKVDFEGKRAIGVVAVSKGIERRYFCSPTGEIILSAGALHSPKILQLSGVGPANHLRSLGIDVVRDSPGVGMNMIEQRGINASFRLSEPLGLNGQLRSTGLYASVLRYLLFKTGVMSTGSHEVVARVKCNPASRRPDTLIALSSTSMSDNKPQAMNVEKQPGMMVLGYPMYPTSKGSVMIRSADPDAPPVIRPNYLTDERDRETSIHVFRYLRKLVSQPALARIVEAELRPGPAYQTDAEILDAFAKFGVSAYHACGTCKMGNDDMAVVDDQLRVKGVSGLRVCDLSVMPAMIAAGTNGPTMAIGWRAGGIIAGNATAR